ncbi:hypothetical protein HD554DRAFT_2294227 [Boletus coccyginus]|nr:hypothetical protein HD554DRAFT_2294227 [Boletus coccyginus]
MEFSYKFLDSSTAIIHECLNLQGGGTRVLYVIVLQELIPITKLVADAFLNCWWDMVKCDCFRALVELGLTAIEGHLALWKNSVHHHDISASNLMYKVEGSLVVGVLIDFDLATIVDSVTGNEHTSTVPFMALALLSKEVLAGKIEHIYTYDAESFIWVLMWICLCYDNGELHKDD